MPRPGLLPLLILAVACGDPPAPAARAQPPAPPPAEAPAPAPSPPRSPDETRVRAHVELVTLGRGFPAELADAVEVGLRRELQVSVGRIDGLALPRDAWYAPRRRYRAERLLAFLNRRLEGAPRTTRVLGLTTVDISTTKGSIRDWGIFGLGELGGRSCVVSTFRLRRRARDDAHRTLRVVTTAVHEVGHTLGLDHCTEPACIMRDAHGSIATVDSSTGVMPECRAELDVDAPRVVRPDDG